MLQMERKASDNKYLHKDFHVTLDLGITYIGEHFGGDDAGGVEGVSRRAKRS